MNIKEFYTQVRADITNENFENLVTLQLTKPVYFNWVIDVFYEMNVKNYPDSHALIWRYNEKERSYTFESIYGEANQFLNFLRTHGIKKGNCIFSQLPLDPANWISLLAAIKGGLVLIPSSINLTEKDIVYRFETIAGTILKRYIKKRRQPMLHIPVLTITYFIFLHPEQQDYLKL